MAIPRIQLSGLDFLFDLIASYLILAVISNVHLPNAAWDGLLVPTGCAPGRFISENHKFPGVNVS